MLEARAEVLIWWESEAFDEFFDSYQGHLTSTQVFLERVFRQMAAVADCQ